MGATQALIQNEIIKAVLNARKSGKNIKKTVKELAKQFGLTEHVVKAVIEMDATYGLEKVGSEKTEGRLWQRMDYTKAIKKLEDKVYELQAEIVRTNQRITKELGLKENPWTRRRLSPFETEEEPSEPQEDTKIPRRQILLKTHEVVDPDKGKERIDELRQMLNKARSRLDGRRTEKTPRLLFRALKEVEK